MALNLRVDDILPFDVTLNEGHTFSFKSTGTTQITDYSLVIEGGTSTLTINRTDFAYSINVTKEQFTQYGIVNGGVYKYSFIVYDSNKTKSKRSSSIQFECYSTPNISVDGITNTTTVPNIDASDFTFKIQYTQAEDRNVDYIVLRIYDYATNTLIKTSNKLRYTDTINYVTYNYTFPITETPQEYYIIVSGETVDGMIFKTNNLPFFIDDTTKIGSQRINATCESSKGYVALECNLGSDLDNVRNVLNNGGYLKLKRKKHTKTEWITVNNEYSLLGTGEKTAIYMIDRNVPNGERYEYAITVMQYNNSTYNELKTYFMKDESGNFTNILVSYNSVFVSINDSTIYRFYSGVVYSNVNRNTDIGVLKPINSKFPTTVRNSSSDYYTLNFKGNIYGENYLENRKISRNMVQLQTERIVNSLVSGSVITITDWNGNIWLGRLTNSPTINYDSNYGNGVTSISFDFVEQGKFDDEQDLYDMGLIK